MTDTLKANGPWYKLSPYIRNREAFKTHGSLSAKNIDAHAMTYTGNLPDNYARQLIFSRADYIVFSYKTPIAWHDSVTGAWTVPDVKYSKTTSAHQTKVRTCVETYSE